MSDDLVERLESTSAARAKATAHDDPANYQLVVARLSHEDASLMAEAAAALIEARAEVQRIRAERDAALARVEKLRHQITEASDPDFIWGAMDSVNDAENPLDDYAAAVSRAIRAAMQIKGDDA